MPVGLRVQVDGVGAVHFAHLWVGTTLSRDNIIPKLGQGAGQVRKVGNPKKGAGTCAFYGAKNPPNLNS